MPLPKVILVPTDFGEPSEAALDYAIDLGRVVQGEIVLLHVYGVPVIGFPDGAMIATAELTSRLLEGAQVGLDRQLASRKHANVPVRGLIKEGDPYRTINDTADELAADLIVMGTHGRRGIPRALIGSVAEKVVRTARVPVLTVHAHDLVRSERELRSSSQAEEPVPSEPVTERMKPNGHAEPAPSQR